jgi:sirohydrochlorin cobaltochelatase
MYPREEGGAVVLMGHGTEHFANAVYPALQTALRLAGREDVLVGTVEGWPGLEDVVRQLAPEGPRHIRLAPLMLVAGEHARSDMAGEWKGRLEAAGHTVQCAFTGLGELPWVQEMYQERLTALLEMI